MSYQRPYSTANTRIVRTIRNQHDMNQTDSIRQAIKLRKDLFMDIWPNNNIEENHKEDGASEEE